MSNTTAIRERQMVWVRKLIDVEERMDQAISLLQQELIEFELGNDDLQAVDRQIERIDRLRRDISGSVPREIVERYAEIREELRQRDKAAGR